MKQLVMLCIFIIITFSGCSAQDTRAGLKEALVGKWESADGYQVEFFVDGIGFIPGVPGSIPDNTFEYTVDDETHITLLMGDQSFSIEILIEGDELTWKDSLGEVSYTRQK